MIVARMFRIGHRGTELSYRWKASDSLGTNRRADCPKASYSQLGEEEKIRRTSWGIYPRQPLPQYLCSFFFEVMKTLFRLNNIYESLSFPSV